MPLEGVGKVRAERKKDRTEAEKKTESKRQGAGAGCGGWATAPGQRLGQRLATACLDGIVAEFNDLQGIES